MKNLIIIIGTILLGALIVNNLILSDGDSLWGAAQDIMKEGNSAIERNIQFDAVG